MSQDTDQPDDGSPKLGPWLSVEHNKRNIAPVKLTICKHCKKRLAVALFELVELVFWTERVWHKPLCGQCGFEIGQSRRVVYPKHDGDGIYSVQKYSSVKIVALLYDSQKPKASDTQASSTQPMPQASDTHPANLNEGETYEAIDEVQ